MTKKSLNKLCSKKTKRNSKPKLFVHLVWKSLYASSWSVQGHGKKKIKRWVRCVLCIRLVCLFPESLKIFAHCSLSVRYVICVPVITVFDCVSVKAIFSQSYRYDRLLIFLSFRFDPERFSEKRSKGRPAMAFSPFGFAGKRQCPAHRFAYVEASIMLVSAVQKFKFLLVPGQDVKPHYGLVTHPKEEIWFKVTKRQWCHLCSRLPVDHWNRQLTDGLVLQCLKDLSAARNCLY